MLTFHISKRLYSPFFFLTNLIDFIDLTVMNVTDREYQKMCQNVEFCKVHPDTEIELEDGGWSIGTNADGEEIETGTVVEYCPKCKNQNKMISLTEREIEEKGEMWYD